MDRPDAISDYDEVAPNASSMIESMRAYGYTLATAVADLVDNSIAAGCTTVWLDSHWSGSNSWISLTDDGTGMTEEDLRDAMRLGSQSPLQERAPTDLGRFGMGLKTASLSQCRSLTVFSKTTPREMKIRRWDLDHLSRPEVHGWQLLRSQRPESTARTNRLDALESGTTVLWEDLDRIVASASKDDKKIRGHFLQSLEKVEKHLAMVFHRFLTGPNRRLRILIDNHDIEPWDPFLETHPATQTTPEEFILLPGHGSPVAVRGFVLPHKDRLGQKSHQAASGPTGWNAQQGFYLYRNERLILGGSWLGLGGSRPWTKEEHYKLARIRLDIPNSMDHLWHLDVKKSSASPPPIIRERLLGLAQTVRQSARSVFSHRGRYGHRSNKTEYQRPWIPTKRSGRTVYKIDRKHPLVEAFMEDLTGHQADQAKAMLRIIEETVPVQQIWLDSAESPDHASAPFHGTTSRERLSIIVIVYQTIRRNRGLDHQETLEVLRSSEEFSDDEALAIIGNLKDEILK